MIRAEMYTHEDVVDALEVGGTRRSFTGVRRTTLTLEVEVPVLDHAAMDAIHRAVVIAGTAALSDANCLRQIADALDGGEDAGSNAKPAEEPPVTTGSKPTVRRVIDLS